MCPKKSMLRCRTSQFSRRLSARLLVALVPLMLVACDGSGGSSGPAEKHVSPGTSVNLSGQLTYDAVPTTQSTEDDQVWRLDYHSTNKKPIRGVEVAAIDDEGKTLAKAITDPQGRYTFSVPSHTQIRLRAVARLRQEPGHGASWDFSIRDNTSAGYESGDAAIYAVQGAAFSIDTEMASRDLHAASGWTGDGYGNARSAAPFSILDQVYSAIQLVLATDQDVVFPPMNAYWSPANLPAEGDARLGEISTSHWLPEDDESQLKGLYILGSADTDTDEYDTGVIVHEWGHYFESALSRSDSIGGNHTSGDVLDMRVAFGEGWGNALAGIVRDDPIYVDTSGPQQQFGWAMNLSKIPEHEPKGWFNEASVQHVIYALSRDLGFGPIYQAMIGPQKATPALTSLFSFASYLRDDADASGQATIDAQLNAINTVSGNDLDIWGTRQLWPASLDPVADPAPILPVYKTLSMAGSAQVSLCSSNAFGADYPNKLGNQQFVRLVIRQAGRYRLQLASTDDIQVSLQKSGQELPVEENPDSDSFEVALVPGDYVLFTGSQPAINACFTVALSQIP